MAGTQGKNLMADLLAVLHSTTEEIISQAKYSRGQGEC